MNIIKFYYVIALGIQCSEGWGTNGHEECSGIIKGVKRIRSLYVLNIGSDSAYGFNKLVTSSGEEGDEKDFFKSLLVRIRFFSTAARAGAGGRTKRKCFLPHGVRTSSSAAGFFLQIHSDMMFQWAGNGFGGFQYPYMSVYA